MAFLTGAWRVSALGVLGLDQGPPANQGGSGVESELGREQGRRRGRESVDNYKSV